MIYFVGGAPRAGKSILGNQVAAKLQIGWISTDVLVELLRLAGDEGAPVEWDAAPAAILATAQWFFPYLERFVWGISSLAENYLIEGVGFLPAQIAQLSAQYEIRPVFLGCSTMTLERFDRFPGRSRGYAALPVKLRRQMAEDVPRWSAYVRQEAERFGYPYVDMSGDFASQLKVAETLLPGGGGKL
jgi:hypothetical protein